MGLCTSKPQADLTSSSPKFETESARDNDIPELNSSDLDAENPRNERKEVENVKKSPFFAFYSPSPAHYLFSKKSPANGSSNSTPRRFFRRPFPPPSPAKHIKAVLARRHGSVKPNEAVIPEGREAEAAGGGGGGNGGGGLDKSFGFSKHFGSKFELGDEVGRGHFGYTCAAKFKKGELKGQQVAVKVIPKPKVCNYSHVLLKRS